MLADRMRSGRMLEIVYPEDTNSQGTLFGGHALSLMDRLAFIVASRFTRLPVVTACSEKVEFRAPVKQGELIELIGTVSEVGGSSLRVSIEMFREDLLSGDRTLCTTGVFVMVAVDGDGRPTPIET
ncbi:MAG: acyl-CoA thioesterase [Deltaproteobacteria bacterium]|nr:acyl-CoA thioesterase [Deltaproteobacteria bacterium]MBW2393693.1 acyl-CoA thioesterase [Deltaproteobacteria bacterium]